MQNQFDQMDEKAIVALNTEEVDAVSGGLCGGLFFLGGLGALGGIASILGGLCKPVTTNLCKPRPSC
ncbi:MAG: hypothetical protein ACK5LJ_05935 [Paracoccus sp. (in: a-proteobacteria)]